MQPIKTVASTPISLLDDLEKLPRLVTELAVAIALSFKGTNLLDYLPPCSVVGFSELGVPA